MTFSPRHLAFLSMVAFGLLINTLSIAQSGQLEAQKLHIGLGAEVGVPTGYLSDAYDFSMGGTLKLQYDLDSPVSLILTSGYTSFIGKQVVNGVAFVTASGSSSRYPSYNLVPVKVGFKAFAASKFYVSAEGGAGFETNSGGSTKLLLSPGFGYGARSGLDLGVRYDYLSGQRTSSGQFVASVAYDF